MWNLMSVDCESSLFLKEDYTNNVWIHFFPNNFTNIWFYYFTFFLLNGQKIVLHYCLNLHKLLLDLKWKVQN